MDAVAVVVVKLHSWEVSEAEDILVAQAGYKLAIILQS